MNTNALFYYPEFRLVMLNNVRTSIAMSDICTVNYLSVKHRFGGFSFSNACAHLVPVFFLIVVFAAYQKSLS